MALADGLLDRWTGMSAPASPAPLMADPRDLSVLAGLTLVGAMSFVTEAGGLARLRGLVHGWRVCAGDGTGAAVHPVVDTLLHAAAALGDREDLRAAAVPTAPDKAPMGLGGSRRM